MTVQDSTHPIIKACNIEKKFSNIKALDGVSLEVFRGEVVALLGANGAGKTTLISHLLGQLTPDSGELSIAGHTPGSLAARQNIGVILQSAQMPGNLTVKEHIELYRRYYPAPLSLKEILSIVKLSDLQHRKFDTLSGGQKQRLFFALAICGQPKIVFLDEPTVGLDVEARRDFWQCIRQLKAEGTSILLTTHYLEEADALADRILLLNNGKIIKQGRSETIKSQLGGKRIRFKTAMADCHFKALSFVTQIQHRGDFTELFSSNAEETLKDLFTQQFKIRDLSVEQVSLEDAFLSLSNNNPTTQEYAA
jgi:ABC-2 type transport system ATP-binding protein